MHHLNQLEDNTHRPGNSAGSRSLQQPLSREETASQILPEFTLPSRNVREVLLLVGSWKGDDDTAINCDSLESLLLRPRTAQNG